MFEILKSPDCIRVFGEDPSTSCMGVFVVDVNIKKPEPFKLLYVNTIFGDKGLYDIPVQFDDTAGTGVMARSYAMMRSTNILVQIFEPDTAICEDNFLGMSPLTFKQLIQVVALQREAFTNNDVHLSMVLPRIAKQIVNADFPGSTKQDVLIGLMDYPWLDTGDIDLSLIDEHSADSGAITLYRCEQIAKHYGVYPDEQLSKYRNK